MAKKLVVLCKKSEIEALRLTPPGEDSMVKVYGCVRDDVTDIILVEDRFYKAIAEVPVFEQEIVWEKISDQRIYFTKLTAGKVGRFGKPIPLKNFGIKQPEKWPQSFRYWWYGENPQAKLMENFSNKALNDDLKKNSQFMALLKRLAGQ